MATVRVRSGCYFIDFRYKGIRYREQTDIKEYAVNRRKVNQLVKRMEAEMTLGTFDYLSYFPNGKSAAKFKAQAERAARGALPPQTFELFAEEWLLEKQAEWSEGYSQIVRYRMDKHILPWFKGHLLDEIDRAMILKFRAHMTTQPGLGGSKVSASCVNDTLLPLKQILAEGALRYGYQDPSKDIKRIKGRRTEIHPFSLQEVKLFLEKVRPDYKAYYTTRFFTGLRSGEIDGLMWKHIDFNRRQILVRQALVKGKIATTKTDGSDREVDMSDLVCNTLLQHRETVGNKSDYVFSTHSGTPLHNRNVTQRVWYPLLRYLGMEKRRPYQTRHTAATLWLAAGENPEWIAKQLGHTTTTMLFQTYSRYVPNLTRRDGSAFERLLSEQFNNNGANNGPSNDSNNT